MNWVDEDVFPSEPNRDDHIKDDEFWNASSSSSILSGNEVVVSSGSSRNISSSLFALDETDAAIPSIADPSGTGPAALRPLYSGVRQSGFGDSLPRVPDLKLAQKSRKGHRKSRQGCFNCKRRKIKASISREIINTITEAQLVPRNVAVM